MDLHSEAAGLNRFYAWEQDRIHATLNTSLDSMCYSSRPVPYFATDIHPDRLLSESFFSDMVLDFASIS